MRLHFLLKAPGDMDKYFNEELERLREKFVGLTEGLTFTELDVHRIEAQHEADNPASGRVMAKCGMQHEGTLRSRVFNKGRYVDVEFYAILRQDWERTANHRRDARRLVR